MPYLVRDRLFIGAIKDAADILQQNSPGEITHILSLLSSASISFFSDWRSSFSVPTQEIRKVFAGGSGSPSCSDDEIDESKKAVGPLDKLLYNLELAGPDLKLIRMGVPLRDMESENLLDYLDVCLDFIERSRREGSVLVHCFAGVSRRIKNVGMGIYWQCSQISKGGIPLITFNLLLQFLQRVFQPLSNAAVITAYLMKTEQLSQEDALESLRQSCEFVCPNDGFLDQLKMFEYMGFKVDHASPIYKRFRMKVLGHSYNRGEKIDSSKFGADPGLLIEAISSGAGPDGDSKPTTPAYRCKKCRRVVAAQENVVGHTPGEGQSCFEWKKRKSGNPFNRSDELECSSIFVEPLKWMTTVEEGALEGKLSCVHCESRLGYFNWSGIQCSCGSWITPAFQLHKSRVDISTL